MKFRDAIVKTGYWTNEHVSSAMIEWYGLPVINLTEISIPASVVDLMPESLARENTVFPLGEENGTLRIVMSDPGDFDMVTKLQFVLNKNIYPALAPREQIVEAINRHYGQ